MQIRVILAAVLGASACTPAFAGPDWQEVGDAGPRAINAQRPIAPPGVLQLNTISGTLSQSLVVPDLEDMYYIGIADPASFSMTVFGSTEFNSAIYLFDISEGGRLGNLDQSATNIQGRLVAASTDGTGAVVDRPGDYLVVITSNTRRPVSITGDMFTFQSITEISGADGPGGFNLLNGWEGEGQSGSYAARFTGVTFPRIPAPGALALLGMGGLVALRRQR